MFATTLGPAAGSSPPSTAPAIRIRISRFKCDRTRKFSPEMLAACFQFLLFRDLLSASHVSHFWRSSALAFPALWSRIFIKRKCSSPAEILAMAISRAGQLPVQFECRPGYQDIPHRMIEALEQHMHHFAIFRWGGVCKGSYLSLPAPLLRRFVCDTRCEIPREFLGGHPGSLRIMRLKEAEFASECPALAAVTELRVTYPQFDYKAHFNLLFSLFPRLEKLELYENEEAKSYKLPAGPAPRTLKKVKLEATQVIGWDVLQLYSTWDLGFVRDVELGMSSLEPESNPAVLFRDALELTVTFDMDENTTRIHAALPDARSRAVVFRLMPEVAPLADILLHDGVLAQTRTLDLPLSVLGPLIAGAPHWPHLLHLTVCVFAFDAFELSAYDPRGPHPRFRWELLDRLRGVPALETLTLRVHCDVPGPPKVKDARRLKRHLATLSDSTPREVRVCGFPDDVVGAMMPPSETDSPKVLFVC